VVLLLFGLSLVLSKSASNILQFFPGLTRATIVLSPAQAGGNMRDFQVPKEKALVLI